MPTAIDYHEFVLPHVSSILKDLETTGAPVIHFGTGTGALLELQRQAGGNVIGVDWRVRLDDAWSRLGHDVAVQGNLDPVLLGAPRRLIENRVRAILAQAAGRPGHVFNLGHGILPDTPPDNVRYVVDLVHELSQQR